MLKSILKGFLVGIGFIIGLYICSKITFLGIDGSIKEIAQSIAQMLLEISNLTGLHLAAAVAV